MLEFEKKVFENKKHEFINKTKAYLVRQKKKQEYQERVKQEKEEEEKLRKERLKYKF